MDLACGPSGRAGKRGEPRRELLHTDLATRANTVDSAKLAQTVQHSLACGRGHDPGVKHALFCVLLGAHMPAVLVETEFISNPDREKKLAALRQQQAIAASITDGVDRFVARRSQLASLGQVEKAERLEVLVEAVRRRAAVLHVRGAGVRLVDVAHGRDTSIRASGVGLPPPRPSPTTNDPREPPDGTAPGRARRDVGHTLPTRSAARILRRKWDSPPVCNDRARASPPRM